MRKINKGRGFYRKAFSIYMDMWHKFANEQLADCPESFSGPNARSAYFKQKDRELTEEEPRMALLAASKVYSKVYNKEATIIYYNWKLYPGVHRLCATLLRKG